MNCPEVRVQLAGLIYGDLADAAVAPIEEHLEGCESCREARTGLVRVRELLDLAPEPEVQVDLKKLYRAAAEIRPRPARRAWPVALAGLAAAAGLLVGLTVNLDVQWSPHEVVVRWDDPPSTVAPVRTDEQPPGGHVTAVADPGAGKPAERDVEGRVKLLNDLVHALAADAATRDRRQQALARWVQGRFEAIETQSRDRFDSNERELTALYTAQFPPRRVGE